MDASLIAMLAAIGIFLVLVIIGMISLLRKVRSLLRAAESLQTKMNGEIAQLMQKQEAAMEKVAGIDAQGQELSEAITRVKENVERLNTLLNEVSRARTLLRNPFSSLLDS